MSERDISVEVNKTVLEYNLLKPKDRVLISISGGADSVALTYILHSLYKDISLRLVYFDHGLRSRKEIQKEINAVNNISSELAIPFIVKKIDVKRFAHKAQMSIETASREKRYAELLRCAKKFHCNKIATGHTRDDCGETILFNIIRGTGLKGLTGIPIKRQYNGVEIIRPLLKVTHKQIVNYLSKRHIPYCIDRTNITSTYMRNRIRRHLLPILKKYNPRLVEHITNTAEIISEEEEYINSEVDKIINRVVHKRSKNRFFLDLKKFYCYNTFLQKRLLHKVLPANISSKAVASIFELCYGTDGRYFTLGKGWVIRKTGTELEFCHKI